MAIPPTSSSGLINISHSSETTHENKTERLLFARMKIHEKHLQRITNTEALMQYSNLISYLCTYFYNVCNLNS
jgi:hypothetical protein